MLTLADVKPGEMVYDLGCGDGRIVITAATKFSARAVGVEIRRDIYETTLARVASLGLAERVRIVHGDALKTDLTARRCCDPLPADEFERASAAGA